MIERKLSAAVLFALAVQTGGVFVWAGGAAERISVLESTVESQRPIAERLARVEAQLEVVLVQLDRIETKLDKS